MTDTITSPLPFGTWSNKRIIQSTLWGLGSSSRSFEVGFDDTRPKIRTGGQRFEVAELGFIGIKFKKIGSEYIQDPNGTFKLVGEDQLGMITAVNAGNENFEEEYGISDGDEDEDSRENQNPFFFFNKHTSGAGSPRIALPKMIAVLLLVATLVWLLLRS